MWQSWARNLARQTGKPFQNSIHLTWGRCRTLILLIVNYSPFNQFENETIHCRVGMYRSTPLNLDHLRPFFIVFVKIFRQSTTANWWPKETKCISVKESTRRIFDTESKCEMWRTLPAYQKFETNPKNGDLPAEISQSQSWIQQPYLNSRLTTLQFTQARPFLRLECCTSWKTSVAEF